MLTAIAGILTGITSLVVALNQAGILKPSPQTQSPTSTPSPSAEASVTSSPDSNSVQQPIETLPNEKPKKEKKK
jgi:hypothetical protein